MAVLLLLFGARTEAAAPQPSADAFDQQRLAAMRPLIAEAIARGELPGCVVAIGNADGVAFLEAFGDRVVEPQRVAMTTDTVFDMASVTKPVATGTSVMRLLETGKLRLRDKVGDLLPGWGRNGKEAITVEQLLLHVGGLIPDNSVADYRDGPEKAWERIYALAPVVEPGTEFKYTDVGFMTLGRIVEVLSGKTLDRFAHDEIFAPLGMTDSGYLPAETLHERTAPTTERDGEWIVGDVHDPRAWLLGGVAGHAGLFSTAEDLARYARMMLGGGQLDGVRILSPATVREMTRGRQAAGNVRGLGWDSNSVYSRNRGELMTDRAFGHGGFTGTGLWIDPGSDLFVVFLSSRLHPDDEGTVNDLIGKIGTIACSAIQSGPSAADSAERQPRRAAETRVTLGVDALARDGFAPLVGKRVGLITNHTGVDSRARRTIDVLVDSDAVDLVRLFSPEHGPSGVLDHGGIEDGVDPESGLPFVSLYGESRKPTPEQLAGLDVLVFDIQDIGCRFYTYIATMKLAMEAAAEHGLRFVVLDRPNPIDGVTVEGPMLDRSKESFVAAHSLPVRHGMTVGELAEMFAAEEGWELDLVVVPVEGWRPASLGHETGQLWVNPSPNMRRLTAAVLYPGVGLLETTNVSVGRGTDTPFEVFGAPWIDPWEFCEALNAEGVAAVTAMPRYFTPDASKHEGKRCGGADFVVTDRRGLDAVAYGLAIARVLHELYPDDWDAGRYNRLLSCEAIRQATLDGAELAELRRLADEGVDDFLQRREAFLLYPR
ncbi:exo-beta-N-acetylmuramidase NamZ domain-containing protein [Pseudobythopirellula maris]|uniref:exo-beta-N-acetylmuramidase NamZ domain-containing protein n=1 Tax=Pseudobythopirellula maris TaxID=2527991 RepID=UPI001E5D8A80|nr:exo-beta-N-acetylmuramidase NamZ domain-containing protein [Pseudobythopirellula maris]